MDRLELSEVFITKNVYLTRTYIDTSNTTQTIVYEQNVDLISRQNASLGTKYTRLVANLSMPIEIPPSIIVQCKNDALV